MSKTSSTFDPDSYLSELLGEHTPPETFEVDLDGKRVWVFRSLRSLDDWEALKARKDAFVKKALAGKFPEAEQALLPKSAKALASLWTVSDLLVEPKLDLLHLARVAANIGGLFAVVAQTAMRQALAKSVELEADEVEEEKKDSEMTPGSD